MACAQNPRKKDLALVTSLAHKFSAVIEGDVRIYRKTCTAIGIYYDFEPAEIDRGNTDIITIIHYKKILPVTPETIPLSY
jgi:hypothetical protein